MRSIGEQLTFGISASPSGAPFPIVWIVCQVDGQNVKLITKDCLFTHEFSEERWKDSKLRKWLNTEIYESLFSDEEKKSILDGITVDNTAVQIMNDYDFEDGKTRKYFDGLTAVPSVISRDKITIPSFSDLFINESTDHGIYSSKNEKLDSCNDEFVLLNPLEEYPTSSGFMHPHIRFGGFANYPSGSGIRLCVWIHEETDDEPSYVFSLKDITYEEEEHIFVEKEPALDENRLIPDGSFFTKVVGVTFKNDDGSDRQRIIRNLSRQGELEEGTELFFEPQPTNPYDSNCILVKANNGQTLGCLSREIAAKVAPQIKQGYQFKAFVSSQTGGDIGYAYGINIKVERYRT